MIEFLNENRLPTWNSLNQIRTLVSDYIFNTKYSSTCKEVFWKLLLFWMSRLIMKIFNLEFEYYYLANLFETEWLNQNFMEVGKTCRRNAILDTIIISIAPKKIIDKVRNIKNIFVLLHDNCKQCHNLSTTDRSSVLLPKLQIVQYEILRDLLSGTQKTSKFHRTNQFSKSNLQIFKLIKVPRCSELSDNELLKIAKSKPRIVWWLIDYKEVQLSEST